jgi:hypothetical protein
MNFALQISSLFFRVADKQGLFERSAHESMLRLRLILTKAHTDAGCKMLSSGLTREARTRLFAVESVRHWHTSIMEGRLRPPSLPIRA